MRRNIVLIDYNKEVIFEKLNNFSNVIDNKKVITKFGNRILSVVDISNRYFNFNFTDFVKTILTKIEDYFEPVKYTFNITKNYQELKIYSHAVDIDGELYFKTLSILNSTDKSYALQVNIGLVHSKTYASFYIKEANEYVSIRNKHFKASLPETIDYFFEAIENLNLIFDEQIKYIQKISNKNVSLSKFITQYLKKDIKGVIIASDILKLRALFYKIYNDTNLNLNLTEVQRKMLKDSKATLVRFKKELETTDIVIESNKLYILYMEVFKNYNTSVAMRENSRFIKILNLI
jgi:hypothetical protein